MEKWTRRERAAVEDIYSVRMCHICKHFIREVGMGGIECRMPCATTRKENFEWRGSQGEEAILKMALDCSFCAWRDRAEKADAELRKCYKDLEQLTAKNNDLRAQVADARIRNDVLQRRLDKLLERFAGVMIETRNSTWERRWCPNKEHQVSCDEFTNCTKCWISYLAQKLEQEVRA